MINLDAMEWEMVDEFPGYLVSNYGDVVKEEGGMPLVKSPTQYGDLTVGFYRDGKQHRRSVKVLVAKAFVEGEDDIFNTPIQKDGNRGNLHHKNIVWRPRWHAIMYTKQFDKPQDWWDLGPIMDQNTHQVYRSFRDAGIETGTLFADIMHSYLNMSRAFPTGHCYYLIDS